MDRFDRIYQLHHLLADARVPVPRRRIEQELECSKATVQRIIEIMRLYLNAPIVYDRARNGYHYATGQDEGFELPGLWFNASELQALLLMQQLLHQVQPGLLDPQLGPIRDRIDQLLQQRHIDGDAITGRIRLLRAAARRPSVHFTRIAEAVVARQRLKISYQARSDGRSSERIVSPQRLTRYRGNWYLEAWCHSRDATRIFAIDRIAIIAHPATPPIELSGEDIDTAFSGGYGIFNGQAAHTRG